MKKSTKKPARVTPEYDSKRETKVLLEEMHKGIKTIAEQHGSVVQRLDVMEADLKEVKSELGTVKMAVMDNTQSIKKLEAGQEEIKQKLDTAIANHEQRLQKLEVA